MVQIAYQDAAAYAQWVGKQLPSEEQWEFAARGGAAAPPEPMDAEGKPGANYYQGVFPVKNLNTDGYVGRASVGCFEPNGFGTYDMIGNVWEWTSASGSRPGASEPVNVIKVNPIFAPPIIVPATAPRRASFRNAGLGRITSDSGWSIT